MKVWTSAPTLRDHIVSAITNQSTRLTTIQLELVLECVDKLGKMDLRDFASANQFTVQIIPKEPEPHGSSEIPIY